MTIIIKKLIGTTSLNPKPGVLNRAYQYPLGVRSTKARGTKLRHQNKGYLELLAKN